MTDKQASFLFNITFYSGIVLIILVFILGCSHTKEGIEYQHVCERHKLYAVQNTSKYSGELNGSFFAIIGHINSDISSNEIVYVYQENNRHSIKLVKYYYSDIEFQFTKNNEQPYIEDCITARKDYVYNYCGVSCYEINYKTIDGYWHNYSNDHTKHYYIIHIPENSILNTFDVKIDNLQ